MDSYFSFYNVGQFEECLKLLDNQKVLDNCLEDNLIEANNTCVCRALVALSTGEDISQVESKLYQSYQNCIALGLPNEIISIELEILLMFNYNWWQLATTKNIVENYAAWNKIFQMINTLSMRVLGETIVLPTINTMENMSEIIHYLAALKDQIIIRHRAALNIFLEYLITVMTGLSLFCKNLDIRLGIKSLINSTLNDRLEILSLCQQEIKTEQRIIFKFGFRRANSNVSDISAENSFDILSVISSTLSSTECNTNSIVKNESCWFPLFNYSEAFHYFQNGNMEKTLSTLLQDNSISNAPELMARRNSLMGLVYSSFGDRHKAVEQLKKSMKVQKHLPTVYYHLGREYGKMGLHDLMLKNYENLIKVIKKKPSPAISPFPIETRMLEIIHGDEEIYKTEAIYLLAVAYGLHERFEDSTLAFEKLMDKKHMNFLMELKEAINDRLVKLPKIVVIIHEAATMNLLLGNLTRSEELCKQAMSTYSRVMQTEESNHDVHGTKDTKWIYTLLTQDLQLSTYQKNPKYDNCYFEDYVWIFDEDVIGLMILADIQKIQQSEDERITLNQALLILSKHISRMQRETSISAKENVWLRLIKALTAKICLAIARIQTPIKEFTDVDRMFKRALSCNNGDKDVLYYYATFLDQSQGTTDARKLWNSFHEKEGIVDEDMCQSLALKYLLRKQISEVQLRSLATRLGVAS